MKVFVLGPLEAELKAEAEQFGPDSYRIKSLRAEPGGEALILAYYLKGFGCHVHLSGSVGRDHWGRMITQRARKVADSAHIRTLSISTSFRLKLADLGPQVVELIYEGAGSKLTLSKEELLKLKPDWIHLTSKAVAGRNGRKNLRAAELASEELGSILSVDFATLGKRARLGSSSAIAFCEEGSCEGSSLSSRIAVIAAGERGCYSVVDGEVVQHEGLGRGWGEGSREAFIASFICAYYRTKSVEASCRAANYAAYYKSLRRGLTARIPFKEIMKRAEKAAEEER